MEMNPLTVFRTCRSILLIHRSSGVHSTMVLSLFLLPLGITLVHIALSHDYFNSICLYPCYDGLSNNFTKPLPPYR